MLDIRPPDTRVYSVNLSAPKKFSVQTPHGVTFKDLRPIDLISWSQADADGSILLSFDHDATETVVRLLLESAETNEKLGISPKCGKNWCDRERRAKKLKPRCPDCGYMPGERGAPNGPIEKGFTRLSYKYATLESLHGMNIKDLPSTIPANGVIVYSEFPNNGDPNSAPDRRFEALTATISFATRMCKILNGENPRRQNLPKLAAPSSPDENKLAATSPLEENNVFVRQMKQLAGRILTVVDASVEGPKNIAIKTLIKKEFREQMRRNWSRVFNHTEEAGEAETELIEL